MDHRAVVPPQGLAVAVRLGVDQLAERVRPARDRAIVGVVGGELQEDACRGAALMELAGRVQEAWAVAGGRGAARCRERDAELGERRVDLGRWRDERLDRHVARGFERGKRGPEKLRERVVIVRPEMDPPAIRVPVGVGVSPGQAVASTGENATSQLLGLLDVRLVERIDAQDDARDRRRDLPADHLAREVHRVVELDADDRLPGLLELPGELR